LARAFEEGYYYYYYYYWWGGTESLGICSSPWYCGHFGLLYKPPMIDEDDFWSNWRNENWQRKPKYSEKTYPSATLSTTKSHMTDPVSIPGPQRWEASD
jgi:hypothetical protein